MLAKQQAPPFGGPGRGAAGGRGGGPGGRGGGGAWRSASQRAPQPAFDWEQEFENLMEKDAQVGVGVCVGARKAQGEGRVLLRVVVTVFGGIREALCVCGT